MDVSLVIKAICVKTVSTDYCYSWICQHINMVKILDLFFVVHEKLASLWEQSLWNLLACEKWWYKDQCNERSIEHCNIYIDQHVHIIHFPTYLLACLFDFIACENGRYGDKCSETCGHCRNVTQCLHTNGTCLTGCKPGYQGKLCKPRE